MRSRFFIAILGMAVLCTLVSCEWFRQSKKEEGISLVGIWKVDSVTVAQDSSIGYALLAGIAQGDSSGVQVEFTDDTMITTALQDADTVGYAFNLKDTTIDIIEKEGRETFRYKPLGPEAFTLTDKGNNIIHLRKQ